MILSYSFCVVVVVADGVGGEPEAEATSAPEIVEQPPREVAAVISEKLLIPLKATGAQLRYVEAS